MTAVWLGTFIPLMEKLALRVVGSAVSINFKNLNYDLRIEVGPLLFNLSLSLTHTHVPIVVSQEE